MSVPSQISRTYTLLAGESNAEGKMPVTLLASRIIEIASVHANALGIGYAALIEKNVGWVLSRLSIEMRRYPVINEQYTVSTWIESYTRRFSERNFKIFAADSGEVLGYARSVWVPMNFATRSLADLSVFDNSQIEPLGDLCEMDKVRRIEMPAVAEEEPYTFRYCDIDFNRHVNTVRYIDVLLNHWPLEHYDKYSIRRIDVFFHHESHFGQTATLRFAPDATCTDRNLCEIVLPGDIRAISAAITWQPASD